MKSLQTVLSIAVLCTIIALSGCGGGGGAAEPVANQQFGKLEGSWKLKDITGGSVFKAGADSTTTGWNNGFTIAFSGTKGQPPYTYTCTHRPPLSVWKATDTWDFGTDPKSTIIRNDDVQITYALDAAGNNLQLTFTFAGTGYSRVSNVSGTWIFNLVPNK